MTAPTIGTARIVQAGCIAYHRDRVDADGWPVGGILVRPHDWTDSDGDVHRGWVAVQHVAIPPYERPRISVIAEADIDPDNLDVATPGQIANVIYALAAAVSHKRKARQRPSMRRGTFLPEDGDLVELMHQLHLLLMPPAVPEHRR